MKPLTQITLSTYGTSCVQRPYSHVFDEWNVVLWVPIQAVANNVERNSFDQFVDGSHDLKNFDKKCQNKHVFDQFVDGDLEWRTALSLYALPKKDSFLQLLAFAVTSPFIENLITNLTQKKSAIYSK